MEPRRNIPEPAGFCGKRGFTLLELVVVVGILVVLASLLWPVLGSSSQSLDLVRCLNLRKKLFQAAAVLMEEEANGADARKPLSIDMNWWREKLRPYGVEDKHWQCPAAAKLRADRGEEDSGFSSDFVYLGVTPYDFTAAPDKGELYLFIEKLPYHNGVNVVVMASGNVTFQNLAAGAVGGK